MRCKLRFSILKTTITAVGHQMLQNTGAQQENGATRLPRTLISYPTRDNISDNIYCCKYDIIYLTGTEAGSIFR